MDFNTYEDVDFFSLLCEELEDLEPKYCQERMRKRSDGEEDLLNRKEDVKVEKERKGRKKEREEERKESERELVRTEGEQSRLELEEAQVVFNRKEDVKVEKERKGRKKEREEERKESERELVRTEGEQSRLEQEEAQEVQMENNIENNKEKTSDYHQNKETKTLGEKDELKKSMKKRTRRGVNDVSERFEEEKKSQIQQVSEEGSALSKPVFVLKKNCDLSDLINLVCEETDLDDPPVPIPLMHPAQPPLSNQPAPPQTDRAERPSRPPLPLSLHQQGSQLVEMEITPVDSCQRCICYSYRGRDRALSFPLLPGLDAVDSCLLPPAPKRRPRTPYSADQLEHLEALFREDHYPDTEKKKVIAESIDVIPQRITTWFRNRRAKWRKEQSKAAKVENKQSGAIYSFSPSHRQTNPMVPTLASNSEGNSSFPGHFATKLPQLAPTLSNQTPPSCNNLLASLNSPGQSKAQDGGQHQLSSQVGFTEDNPSNPTPAHTLPLFLDTLEGSLTLVHVDIQPLQIDTSSLFDFGEKLDYLTPSQQNTSLSEQLQTSCTTNQSQLQPEATLPGLACLTPSPDLTPYPLDSSPSSYLTFGPGGNSSGMVNYSSRDHTYLQSQSGGQTMLQSAGHHGGITAYQSDPWANEASFGATIDHQPLSSTALPPSSFYLLGDLELLDSNSQCPSHSQTQTTTSSSSTISLSPVSTLMPSHLSAEDTPSKVASLLPASPESPPVPPCVEIEYDSPPEIHSHFHCDFSPIHF